MNDIRLVDLDLFKRYSLAIRQETAPVDEVLVLLDATRRQVLAAAGRDATVAASIEIEDVAVRAPAPPPAETETETDKAEEAQGPEETQGTPGVEEGENGAESEWAPQEPPPARRRVRRATGPPPGAGR